MRWICLLFKFMQATIYGVDLREGFSNLDDETDPK